MSELRDRLEKLATRGSRRGADAVLRVAQRTVPADTSADTHATNGDLEVIDDLPLVTPDPARRRGRFGTLIAATGVAALVAVGGLAVTAMFGSGGADSPEGAVHQLADAVAHKDPLAAVDVLEPTEVRSMRETVKGITNRAADLKIVDNASQPLAGVDLSVDNLQLSSANVGDGFAKVTITSGTISASAHREALSHLLQDATRTWDAGQSNGKVDLARLAAGNDLPTFVMTVRHDGHWYVSPMYTALEYAREAAGGAPADFGSAHAAQLGADSPEHAVSDALHAWQASDWERLIALAPPDELPVYDYRAWLEREAADLHPDFTINSLSTTADVSGDHGVVKLEASGTMGSGNDRSTWQVGGTCPSLGDYFSWSYSGNPQPSNGGPGLCLAGDFGNALPMRVFTAEPSAGAASGPVSIEVVREDGRWFVSPVSTVLDSIDNFVAHVDARTIYPLINLGYLLPPDATLTLNQPTSLPPSNAYNHVLAFDGTAGQEVIGQAERASGNPGFNYYVSGELYTTDGKDVGNVDFAPKGDGYYGGSTTPLPVTGSYRLVIFSPVPTGTTLTLYDRDHAPKDLLNPPGIGNNFSVGGGVCKRTLNSETCTATSLPPPTQTGTGSSYSYGESSRSLVATTTVP